MKKAMILPAVLLVWAALPSFATSFTSDAYYVGAQDIPNDLDFMFTLTGAGLTLSSSGTLRPPFAEVNNSGTPFWNTWSVDGAGKNFGNCLYTPAPNLCTGGAPVNPLAQYLSNAGASVAFEFFGATGSVSYTSNAVLQGAEDTLYWCNVGGCHALSDGSFTPGTGNFWLKLVDTDFDPSFSNTPSADGSYNFAAALNASRNGSDPIAPTPEPVSFALAGSGLLGIYLIRRRKSGAR